MIKYALPVVMLIGATAPALSGDGVTLPDDNDAECWWRAHP
jgi:hypothetical protein